MPIDRPKIDNLMKLIQDQIASGQLAPGQQLPGSRQLAKEHGMAYATVRIALDRLKSSGVLVTKPQKGFYVPE